MQKILDIITARMQKAFEDAGYDASFGRVTVSNRPDLCEYQCNGALVLLGSGQSAVALVLAQVRPVGNGHTAEGGIIARFLKGFCHLGSNNIENFFHN